MRYYTNDHEWVDVDGDIVSIGITKYAKDQLGDVVFYEANVQVGDEIDEKSTISIIESVKAASDVYSPFGGKVTDVNLVDGLDSFINEDPESDSCWMVKIKTENLNVDELMSEEDYLKFIGE